MSTSGNGERAGLLAGRVALVSGGAQGIGLAIAQRFQREGASVFVLDCDRKAGEDAAAKSGCPCSGVPLIFLPADLREEGEVRGAIEEVCKRGGHLDVLVNNAGIELERSVSEWTMAEWDLILKVNLRGAFLLTQAALPLFPAEGGAIVNISSVHATHAFPGSIPYACSKAGLIAMTRNLALELAPRHIRVNSVCPGYIDTRLWDEYLKKATNSAELAAYTTALHPLGRRGQSADVAEAVLFLAGQGSSFVTGSDLVVDGGLTLRAHA